MDWQRGYIPYCNYPPDYVLKPEEEKEIAEEEMEKLIIEKNNEKLEELKIIGN